MTVASNMSIPVKIRQKATFPGPLGILPKYLTVPYLEVRYHTVATSISSISIIINQTTIKEVGGVRYGTVPTIITRAVFCDETRTKNTHHRKRAIELE